MSRVIDGILKEWGELLYYAPVRGRLARRTVTHSRVTQSIKPLKAAGTARIREKLALTTHRVPEVMVKISGGGKGMRQIKAHLDYISRNGCVELENEDGETIVGREAVRDLRDEWKNGQYGIPEEGQRREALNIVLSMPPGTDRRAVKEAARAFAASEFGANHAYVFAAHDDERHPHVHLCVKSLGIDGSRLNPRKADLQHWRERFAEALRDCGIEANATPRIARGATRRAEKQAVWHMEKDGRFEAVRERRGIHGARQDNFSAMRKVVYAYGKLARTLVPGNAEDQRLALAITRFVGEMPVAGQLRSRFRSTEHKKTAVIERGSSEARADLHDRER
ncbi:relaxase/mobilization nuclease domain-containing protein [Pandoraea sp. CB10b_02]|uniref:relaxase/mobilization nuclease domain-containing protein n=1 Tax=Pandoraea sp. CB10b_02 TaxID=2014535 RepID=UPI00257B863C|nr:relaxase/mobilization nuclease domain-containing protein [Pandoraea sp. CB10b_02]